MTFGTKLCLVEPIGRKFGGAVRHIPSAKNTEREHLFWGEFRLEIGMKILADRFSQQICIILLHLIVDLDPAFFHKLSQSTLAALTQSVSPSYLI